MGGGVAAAAWGARSSDGVPAWAMTNIDATRQGVCVPGRWLCILIAALMPKLPIKEWVIEDNGLASVLCARELSDSQFDPSALWCHGLSKAGQVVRYLLGWGDSCGRLTAGGCLERFETGLRCWAVLPRDCCFSCEFGAKFWFAVGVALCSRRSMLTRKRVTLLYLLPQVRAGSGSRAAWQPPAHSFLRWDHRLTVAH